MMYQILTLFATPVFADDYGLEVTAKAASLEQFGANLPGLIGNVLGTALSLVGVLFFALMLYGGITWMMAHGNAESEKKALSTITAAIIGILIVLGSYALTTFVLSSVKGGGGGGGNKCTEKHPTWACQNIDKCAVKPNLSEEEKTKLDCSGKKNCELNLCSGDATNVCCES